MASLGGLDGVSIEVSGVGALPDAPTTTTLSVSWLQSVFELSAAADSSCSATFGDSTGAEPFPLLLAGSIPGHRVQVIQVCTCMSRASADAPLNTPIKVAVLMLQAVIQE